MAAGDVMATIGARLAAGGTVILDGATGTELERRGVPMSGACWCALGTRSHPDVLRDVHKDYIDAGADIVTANTFATSRHMLAPAGLADETAALNRRAVEIAREARDAAGRAVAVAGSISTMRPVLAGQDRRDPAFRLTSAEARAHAAEQAEAQAVAGADLILLEMIGDPTFGGAALEAALATGLPVWLGFSVRRDAAGAIRSFHDDGLELAELVDAFLGRGVEVMGIMHSGLPETEAALPLLRQRWPGPLMVYPESGYFESPHWRFVELDPATFAARAAAWRDQGVQIVGGCCGLGPQHIRALAEALGTRH